MSTPTGVEIASEIMARAKKILDSRIPLEERKEAEEVLERCKQSLIADPTRMIAELQDVPEQTVVGQHKAFGIALVISNGGSGFNFGARHGSATLPRWGGEGVIRTSVGTMPFSGPIEEDTGPWRGGVKRVGFFLWIVSAYAYLWEAINKEPYPLMYPFRDEEERD